MSQVRVKDMDTITMLVEASNRASHFYGDLPGLKRFSKDRDRIMYDMNENGLLLHPIHDEFADQKDKHEAG